MSIDHSRSLLDIEHLEKKDILAIFRLARRMNPSRPKNTLYGKKVILLFYEASTRTRVSFELAAKSLGAATTLVTATASSIEKGESLIDTGGTLIAEAADAIVMRHPSSGAPYLLARHFDIPIINAGDGLHAHPSQALLDAYTILKHHSELHGLRVTIIGDIFHSRVARSNIHLLTKFGAHVTLCGPPELAPEACLGLSTGLRLTRDIEDAVHGADVVMLLRVQKERLQGMALDIEEYISNYQMTMDRLKLAKRTAILMHPGPIIRGMELTDEVADCPQSVILEQVHNGLLVRMAILERLLGAKGAQA
jgi:aspartate carbamoyltransferase catalytic subunit